MDGFKLRYGRWVLRKGRPSKPYLSIGRWVLEGVSSSGSPRKAEG